MKALNPRQLLYLIFSFIIFTVIGTLSHEYGHIAVAKYYGYKTTLHYGSMSWERDTSWKPNFDTMQTIYWRHKTDQDNEMRHEESDRLDSLKKVVHEVRTKANPLYKSRMITIGGPAQTLLTSILGIFILLYRRKDIIKHGMKVWDWLGVFLALFSLRFVSNMTLSMLSELGKPNGSYFSGDEASLARSLDLPTGTFAVPLFFIGFAIALWVIFKILPQKDRLTFIASGMIGGVLGYLIWLKWLGHIILP